MSQFFTYTKKELEHLLSADKDFERVINCVGKIKRSVEPNLFAALVYSIVGQQISTKAQENICKKMRQTLGEITPQKIDSISDAELQAFGISFRKVSYIKSAAKKITSGEFEISNLENFSDADVVKRLTSLKGVGVWTAEMLMIFSLMRKDVLSFSDFAIQRGLRMIYRHRKITPKLFEKYRRRFSPCASLASLYIWEISSGKYEGFIDLAGKIKK